MKTEGYRRTLHGSIDGHSFQIAVASEEDDVFSFRAIVDGAELEVPYQNAIRNKGDAMQLALVAIERHIEALGRTA
ncbi:hypothetical protein [Stenotrophomonas maltophilia]|uniref:hypothetical protein n=1 Tax=Stenotrophomonas maltophilia TaxID=40324 RepID=UPI0039F64D64